MANQLPRLHNALWPGLVGKGSPGAEPLIPFDTMLDWTAKASVGGMRFDGVDVILAAPHIDINARPDALKRIAAKVAKRGLAIGSLVAPVWGGLGGGSAMGSRSDRAKFVTQVRKSCVIARTFRDLGVRQGGVVRIDSADSPANWLNDPKGNTKRIVATFREAAKVAADHGERLAAEGEICWAGMHGWKSMLEILEGVGMPETLGFQADLAHTYLYLLGWNAPEQALLKPKHTQAQFWKAYQTLTDALRPWTFDVHIAQNDGTVHGSGTHDKTGRHCLATDPAGKLDIVKAAGYWLTEGGRPMARFSHICWDGCMFANKVLSRPKTWNDILATLIRVRDAHGLPW
ncbi:MAG: TIM barrel protein [Phycisphaerae bacterium]|jgi:sugar phosphate isomerase/epimerase|nr:TIM barrel protein [Phycisphaerae bacterium]